MRCCHGSLAHLIGVLTTVVLIRVSQARLAQYDTILVDTCRQTAYDLQKRLPGLRSSLAVRFARGFVLSMCWLFNKRLLLTSESSPLLGPQATAGGASASSWKRDSIRVVEEVWTGR